MSTCGIVTAILQPGSGDPRRAAAQTGPSTSMPVTCAAPWSRTSEIAMAPDPLPMSSTRAPLDRAVLRSPAPPPPGRRATDSRRPRAPRAARCGGHRSSGLRLSCSVLRVGQSGWMGVDAFLNVSCDIPNPSAIGAADVGRGAIHKWARRLQRASAKARTRPHHPDSRSRSRPGGRRANSRGRPEFRCRAPPDRASLLKDHDGIGTPADHDAAARRRDRPARRVAHGYRHRRVCPGRRTS